MGIYSIRTPDIGEGIAEVELVAWHVKPGDTVKEDQVLADVMTDKATVEIPSPVTGKVTELIRVQRDGATDVLVDVAGFERAVAYVERVRRRNSRDTPREWRKLLLGRPIDENGQVSAIRRDTETGAIAPWHGTRVWILDEF